MVALTTLALAAFGLYARSNASPTASTFLEPTASTANPTASGVTIDHGKAYIQYSSVPGFFLQDETSTNQTSFDYVSKSDCHERLMSADILSRLLSTLVY